MYCFCKIRCFLYFLRYRCIYIKSYFKIKTNRYINTKRVGILIDSIEKYIGLMQNYDIPYVIVNNGKIVYKCSGKFDFVLKTPKFESLIELLYMKDKILEYILKILSKNLGEVI